MIDSTSKPSDACNRLKSVKDEEDVGPDGVTIKGRLQELVNKTVEDIKQCANTCDAYSKMKLLAKVLKGPLWEGRLISFVQLFSQRRDEFQFALAAHTGRKIGQISDKMDSLTRDLKQKTDMILNLLQTYVAPDQKELRDRIEQKGGSQVVLQKDDILRELIASDSNRPSSKASKQGIGHSHDDSDLKDLKEDLRDDPAAAVAKNLSSFERKLEMQQRQILQEVGRIVTRDGDRVIKAVTSGPHDKLVDPDLHVIWKEMGWRGSVKARHFVLALRDYYREQADDRKHHANHLDMADTDDLSLWALEWITVNRLQSIVEAFDDDASGFITVAEANRFTTSRPLKWSLLHWLAYWAIGWQMSATTYRDRIDNLISKMFALRASVHVLNRDSVEEYLSNMWPGLTQLTESLERFYPTETLQGRFQLYIDEEEERIKKNLEDIRYHIDEINTLILTTGEGRIEKYLFPLLFLLLKRHYELLRLCRTKIVNEQEWQDSTRSIEVVFQAVRDRYDDLAGIFRQQNLDLKQQFKVTSCGLFGYWHDSEDFFARKHMREFPFDNDLLDVSEVGTEDSKPESLLTYPLESGSLLDTSAYGLIEEIETEEDLKADEDLKAILGSWHGFLAQGDDYPYDNILSVYIHASAGSGRKFEASGKWFGDPFTLTGEREVTPEGLVSYSFSMNYPSHLVPMRFCGSLDSDARTLRGTWGWKSVNSSNQFIFSRCPASIFSCRPSFEEFEKNKTAALWKFALSAVQDQIRRQMFSWSFFKRRREVRKRYVHLTIRDWRYGYPLNQEELDEYARLRQTLSSADVQYYRFMVSKQLRMTPNHLVYCDNCGGWIIGTRVICLDCDTNNTVDLCEDGRCLSAAVELEQRPDLSSPHLPSHDIFKVRAVAHQREFGKLDLAARNALKRARDAFTSAASVDYEKSMEAKSEDRRLNVSKRSPTCIVCSKLVSQPCWHCIICDGDTFICNECDQNKGGVTVKEHKNTHGLVRCQERVDATPPSVEQRLETLESKFVTMDSKLIKVDDRLSRIETLLHSISLMAVNPDAQRRPIDKTS
ncbi:hypothetical protein AcW1_008459 [Taiwanofungus camphoratus]|nr:hypothetical protein AcW1_008459 [Antrodia cinnamomea]